MYMEAGFLHMRSWTQCKGDRTWDCAESGMQGTVPGQLCMNSLTVCQSTSVYPLCDLWHRTQRRKMRLRKAV